MLEFAQTFYNRYCLLPQILCSKTALRVVAYNFIFLLCVKPFPDTQENLVFSGHLQPKAMKAK